MSKTKSSQLKSLNYTDISHILSELGFQSHLEIKYRFRYKGIFLRPDINPELLNDIYTNWKDYFKGRTGEVWGTKYYRALSNDPDKIKLVCSFLRRCAVNDEVALDNLLVYNVFDENNTLVDDSEVIRLLSNLDILLRFRSLRSINRGMKKDMTLWKVVQVKHNNCVNS